MPTAKLPKRLTVCVDKLYTTRDERYRLQKLATELKKDETALRAHILAELAKQKSSGIAGKVARVAIRPKTRVVANDWDALYKYVKRSGSFELLQRRLNDTAIKERWDDGRDVPGTEAVTESVLSIHRLTDA
jgi:hypothetical protein